MTGFDSKRQAAQDKMNDDANTLTIVYQRGFADGKRAAQRKPFDILAITTAYEQGVGKGHQAHGRGVEMDNPYTPGECQQAWSLGYTEGKKQAAPKVPHNIKEQP
jgi:hypothetical protein